MWWKWKITQSLFLSALGVLLIGAAIVRPVHNWDMIAYAAAAVRGTMPDEAKLQRYVFGELRESVNPKTYDALTGHIPAASGPSGSTDDHQKYRQAMATDSEVFVQQLPIYEIKPLYVWVVCGLTHLGLPLFTATSVTSGVSTWLGMVVLWAAFSKELSKPLLYVFTVFALCCGLLTIAQSSTPDSMAFLAVSLIAWCWMRWPIGLLIVVPFSILARPDLLFFGALVLVDLVVTEKSLRVMAVLSFPAMCAVYLGAKSYYGFYGWATIFHHSFVGLLTRPADYTAGVSVVEYLHAVAQGGFRLLWNGPFLCYAGLMASGSYLWHRYRPIFQEPKIIHLAVIGLPYIVLHFVLFPNVNVRFFVGQYLLGILGVLYLMTQLQPLTIESTSV